MTDQTPGVKHVNGEPSGEASFETYLSDALSAVGDSFQSGDHAGACQTLTDLCETLNSYDMAPVVLTIHGEVATKAELLRTSVPREWAWFIDAVATAFVRRGQFEQADEILRQVLTIGDELSDPLIVSTGLHNLGTSAFYSGDRDRARRYYTDSLRLKEQIGDKRGVAQLQNNLASMATEDGDLGQARILLASSLAIKRRLRDSVGLISTYGSLGNLEITCCDYKAARKAFILATQLARRYGGPNDLAQSLLNLGNVLCEHGQHDRAIEGYIEGLSIARDHDLPATEEMLQAALALALYRSGRREEAVQEFLQLGEIKGRLMKRFDRAIALHDAAVAAIECENTEDGLDYYRLAERGFRAAGNAAWRGRCLWEAAGAMAKHGRAQECRSAINSAMRVLATAGEHSALLDAYEAGVQILFDAGHPDWAVRLFKRESAYLEHRDEMSILARRSVTVAHLLQDRCLPGRALPLLSRAVGIYADIGESSLEALTRNDLALARIDTGHLHVAVRDYESLITDARLTGNRVLELLALTNLAEAERRRGRSEKAIAHGLRALDLAGQLHDTESVPMLLNNLGLAYEDIEDDRRAECCFRESLDAARSYGDAEAQARAISSLGSLNAKSGRYGKALAFYDRALRSLGTDPQQLVLDILRNRLMCLIALGREDEASDTATRAVEIAQARRDYAAAEDICYRVALAGLQSDGLASVAESLVFSLLFASLQGASRAWQNLREWIPLLVRQDHLDHDAALLRLEVYSALDRHLPSHRSTVQSVVDRAQCLLEGPDSVDQPNHIE